MGNLKSTPRCFLFFSKKQPFVSTVIFVFERHVFAQNKHSLLAQFFMVAKIYVVFPRKSGICLLEFLKLFHLLGCEDSLSVEAKAYVLAIGHFNLTRTQSTLVMKPGIRESCINLAINFI